MLSSSENSKSPFRGLECLRPFERGERCVAVATDLLYRAVALFAVQMDTQHFYGWIQLSALIQYPGKRSPERLKLRCSSAVGRQPGLEAPRFGC